MAVWIRKFWFPGRRKAPPEPEPEPEPPDFTLVRLEHGVVETIGVLLHNGRLLCLTLELGWLDNERDISCIPTGRYRCWKRSSGRWEVLDVPGRSGILFHVGNSHYDTTGCILLGMEIGWGVGTTRMVLASRNALAEFEEHVQGKQEFVLEIVNGVYKTRPHGEGKGVRHG
jgi:hypothetical protein